MFKSLLLNKATAWVVLFASLIASGSAWIFAYRFVERGARQRFVGDVALAQDDIVQRMRGAREVLRAGAALLGANSQIDRTDWERFVRALKVDRVYPGTQGVGYAAMVPAAGKREFEQRMRAQGLAEFSIWPEGARERYSAIQFLEPFDWRNRRALGYDMLVEPVRRAAMLAAAETGHATLSGPVRLVQENGHDDQVGVLLYQPLYRRGAPLKTAAERSSALVGFVYSPFRMGDLIQGTLGRLLGAFSFQLSDVTDPVHPVILYTCGPPPAPQGEWLADWFPSRYSLDRTLTFAGRTWRARYVGTGDGGAWAASFAPALIGVGGVLATLLLFSTLLGVARRAEAALGEKQRLEGVLEAIPFAMVMTDEDGWIRQVNAACERLFGYERTELIGRAVEVLLPPWLMHRHAAMRSEFTNAPTARVMAPDRAVTAARKDGTPFQAEVNLVPIWIGGQRFVIAGLIDLSRRNRLEFQSKLCEAIVESSQNAIISKTLDGIVTSWNPKAAEMFGYAAEDMIGRSLQVLFPPERAAEEADILARIRRGERVNEFETVRLRRDGSRIDVAVTISPIRDEGGRIVGASKVARDISVQIRQARDLRERELRYRGVVEASPDGFWLASRDGRLIGTNAAYARMSGYTQDELLGLSIADLEAAESAEQTRAHIDKVYREGFDRFETQHRRKDGSRWPAEITVSLIPMLGDMFVFVRDLSTLKALEAERARAEQMIRNLAFEDPLTGLPNRRLLLDRLSQALAAAARNRRHGAVLFIDMDRFKLLNDAHGHEAGDQFLIQVARRMQDGVRTEDTVARLGGDEFVVMLVGLSGDMAESLDQVRHIGLKLVESLGCPYQLGSGEHRSTASIGATLFIRGDDNVHAILNRADTAMYSVKAAGGQGFSMFEDGLAHPVAHDAD